MAFNLSAGVYGREFVGDVTADPQIGFTGAALITAPKGPLEPTLVTSERDFYNKYGKPTTSDMSMHVVARFLKRGNVATVRRVTVDAVAASDDLVGDVDPYLTFTAANPGAWGNDISVSLVENADDATLVDVTVSYNGSVVESYTVSMTDGAIDGFGRPRYVEDRINGNSAYVVVEHDATETYTFSSTADVLNLVGGADDTTPVGDTDLVSAVEDFRNTDEVQANYFINAGWTGASVQSAMVDVMEFRKDGVVILDMPNTTDSSALVTFRKDESNINSSYAAYYAGWIRVLETETGKEVYVPPSGDIAAVYSATQQGTIWDAPAGLRRGAINGILGMNKIWSEGDRDVLYKAGINPIQTFAGEGTVVWGQKTALGFAASLSRLNVRFLLNYIRNTAITSLKPFVFQANTEFTRSSIFSLLDNFMAGIEANDGVYGYKIEIGTDLNDSDVISSNQLLVNILVQPTRTAEFIRVDTITVPLSQDL